MFIFGIAGLAVVWEVSSSKAKDDAKAVAAKAEKEQLRSTLEEIAATLRDTLRSVETLDGRLAEVERAEALRRARWWQRGLGWSDARVSVA